LQAVLTRFAVTTPGVFLYHPGRSQELPKLRAFIEHVKYHARDDKGRKMGGVSGKVVGFR
jgi:hypothetical protein